MRYNQLFKNMKSLISVLFLVLSLYSCSTNKSTVVVQKDGDLSNVAYESFRYCGELNEKPKQLTNIIINSYEEMHKEFTSCETFVNALPDFTQKRIFGLISEPKPTAGYVLKIQSVMENDKEILVEYFEKAPKKEDFVATVITYPADYIILPKSNKKIRFSKVNDSENYVIVGTYFGHCRGGDCRQFFRIENQKVIQYLNVNYGSNDFDQYSTKTLSFKNDYEAFLRKIPTEIKDLKGKTKTFGMPDSHDQGGVYFEMNQHGIKTKINLDTDNTPDQTANVISFKKAIKAKIAELKTKS